MSIRIREIRIGKEELRKMYVNRRVAVKMRCKDCCAGSNLAIQACDAAKCPLFLMRMTGIWPRANTESSRENHRKHAIRDYCLHCMNGQRQFIHECIDIQCSLWEFRSLK